MFEVLLSNYRLPRAHYRGLHANALLFDAKLFHLNLLRGVMVVQDEKSVHFRIMSGSYISHDAKSTHFRNVTGTYLTSDPQFNKHAAVTMSYLTEDQQSFSLYSVNANAAINDGNGGLYVARNTATYAVDDQMMRIGLGLVECMTLYRQEGIISPFTVGQIAVPAIEMYPMGIVSANGMYVGQGRTGEFGIVGSFAQTTVKEQSLFTASVATVAQTCVKLPDVSSMSPNAVIGLVAVKDAIRAS